MKIIPDSHTDECWRCHHVMEDGICIQPECPNGYPHKTPDGKRFRVECINDHEWSVFIRKQDDGGVYEKEYMLDDCDNKEEVITKFLGEIELEKQL